MNRVSKFRAAFVLLALSVAGLVVVVREHRPSFLRPDLHSNAYVTTAGGLVAVVDLVKNSTIARVSVGPDASDLRAHPSLKEIWGVSPAGGYVWVLDASNNQLKTEISIGGSPYSIEFSRNAKLAYTTSMTDNFLLAIDCATKQVVARASTGSQPVAARVTPDGKSVLVVNHRDFTLAIPDSRKLILPAAD